MAEKKIRPLTEEQAEALTDHMFWRLDGCAFDVLGLSLKVKYPDEEEEEVHEHLRKLAKELQENAAIILAYLSGSDKEREEITGISTRGKNKNFGNTGFAGGCAQRDWSPAV